MRFHIVDHRKHGSDTEIVYHCPACLNVHTKGKFTIESIENEGVVLGTNERKECCDMTLPTPMTFMRSEEAQNFFAALLDSAGQKHILIRKPALLISWRNPVALAESYAATETNVIALKPRSK